MMVRGQISWWVRFNDKRHFASGLVCFETVAFSFADNILRSNLRIPSIIIGTSEFFVAPISLFAKPDMYTFLQRLYKVENLVRLGSQILLFDSILCWCTLLKIKVKSELHNQLNSQFCTHIHNRVKKNLKMLRKMQLILWILFLFPQGKMDTRKSFLPLTWKIYVQLETAWHKHFKKVNWTATIYKSRS